jgi:hypothetical protein
MIDARFERSATWRRQNAEVCTHAGVEVDQVGDRRALVRAMADFLTARFDDSTEDAVTEPTALPEGMVADAEQFVLGHPDLPLATWWTITSALAELACASAVPSLPAIVNAWGRLERCPAWAASLFEDSCVDVLSRKGPAELESWLAALGASPVVTGPAPRPPAAVSVYRPEREWSLRDPLELWRDDGAATSALVAMAGHVPINLLRRLESPRWFRSVDGWTDARLVVGALHGDHVLHDREALLAWLALAEPAFDPEGKATGRTAALVLTEFVVEHAQALCAEFAPAGYRTDDEAARLGAALDALRGTELPNFFAEAWRIVLGRQDGLVIAAAFHAHLCDVRPFRGLRRAIEIIPIARKTLARALAKHGATPRVLQGLWTTRKRAREAGSYPARAGHASGVCALRSAVEVLEEGGPRTADLTDLAVEIIRAPDPDWTSLAKSGELDELLTRVVAVLGGIETSLARCERLYEELAPQRRRGEFGRTYYENDTDLPSVLALVLLCSLIADERIDRVAARAALRRVLPWATRLFLTCQPAWSPTLEPSQALILALVIAARVEPMLLREALPPVLADPPLAARAVAALLGALPIHDVRSILATIGDSIDLIAGRASEWALARPDDQGAADALAEAAASAHT